MTNEEKLKRCAEIEYDCWERNLAPILNISEYLYFQTKTSLKKTIEKKLENENTHLVLFSKKFLKKDKKSSSETPENTGFSEPQNRDFIG